MERRGEGEERIERKRRAEEKEKRGEERFRR